MDEGSDHTVRLGYWDTGEKVAMVVTPALRRCSGEEA